MKQYFTAQRIIAAALGVLAIGSWRLWRRPVAAKVSREVALLKRLAKARRT